MAQKTIIVIGGAHGGPTAAARARQFNEDARILLIEKGNHISWVQADLRHHLEGDLTLLFKSLKDRETHYSKRYDVEIRTGSEVTAIDVDSKFVTVKSGNTSERIGFDTVIFAGGAISIDSGIKDLTGPFVTHFRNLDDISKIKEAIGAGAKTAVVMGCGLFGLDAAEGLRAAGLKVDVVEKAPRIVPRFSLPAANAMIKNLQELGTTVHLNDYVVGASPKSGLGFHLKLASKKTLDADLVVVTVGSRPRTELLAHAGASLQKDGSVRVNAHMATTLAGVYACGSAVSVPQVITNERMWLPQPANIERTAQVAGQNAAVFDESLRDEFQPVTGTQIVRIGANWYARTGLTGTETRKHLGDERIASVWVHSRSAEAWFGGEDISVHLTIDRQTEAIVGGEVLGKEGVERRIDLISAAIGAGWSPRKLVDLDLAYAASRGPAFDPLKEAGMRGDFILRDKIRGLAVEKLALWVAEEKPFSLIDVSQEKPTQKGQLPKSFLHMPLEQLRERLTEVDKKHPIILTSRSGRRAYLAHQALLQRGFKDIYHLDGGNLSWTMLMGN